MQLTIHYNVLGKQTVMICPRVSGTDFSSVWSMVNMLHEDIEYLINAGQPSTEKLEATQATDRHDALAMLFFSYDRSGYNIVIEFEEDTPLSVIIRLLSHELAECIATESRRIYREADQL